MYCANILKYSLSSQLKLQTHKFSCFYLCCLNKNILQIIEITRLVSQNKILNKYSFLKDKKVLNNISQSILSKKISFGYRVILYGYICCPRYEKCLLL